jgi:hypothetical protein
VPSTLKVFWFWAKQLVENKIMTNKKYNVLIYKHPPLDLDY